MSVSQISSSISPATSHTDRMKQMKEDLDSLQKALDSGDLNAAKRAIETIQKDRPQGGPRSSKALENDPLAQIEKAIGSGDLQAAQSAMSQMVNAMKSHAGHPPAQNDNDGDNDSSSSLNASGGTLELSA